MQGPLPRVVDPLELPQLSATPHSNAKSRTSPIEGTDDGPISL